MVRAQSVEGHHRGALTSDDGVTIAAAAAVALEERLPLVLVVASSGSEVAEGIDALTGGAWRPPRSRCSGSVPVLTAGTGPAISGPALLLGLADVCVMTPDAFAFVSGPDAVLSFTGVQVGLHDLGGTAVHATSSGLCALEVPDADAVDEALGALLSFLPDHTDVAPTPLPSADPVDRATPELPRPRAHHRLGVL